MLRSARRLCPAVALTFLTGCPQPAQDARLTPFNPVIGDIVVKAPTGIPAGRYAGATMSTTTVTVLGEEVVESTTAETAISIDAEGFYVSDAGERPAAGEQVEERTEAGRLLGVLTAAEIDAGRIVFHNAVQLEFDGPAGQSLTLAGESETTYVLLADGTIQCDALIFVENTDDGPSISIRIEGVSILTRE
jgi:hypothetical protein